MENTKPELASPGEHPDAPLAGDAGPVEACVSVSRKRPRVNVGMSDYKKLTSRSLYIDKTLIVKDILDDRDSGVFLFTRPRRFGKTFMFSTLKAFFEKPGSSSDVPATEDTSQLFQNREIWGCGEEYQKEQGKYPVISLTFKDCKASTWEKMYGQIYGVLQKAAIKHADILNSKLCDVRDLDFIRDLIDKKLLKAPNETTSDKPLEVPNETTSDKDLKAPAETTSEKHLEAAVEKTLDVLSTVLSKHYGVPVIILIDEYDVPLQQSFIHGYYDQAKEFYGNLLSNGLKDNTNLKYAFLTGILQAAQAGIFSGLNNLQVFSVLKKKYSTYFGFTEAEVKQLTQIYGREDKYPEICEWYDGYCFGGNRIFNPVSVLSYFDNDCEAGPYWLETSENALLPFFKDANNNVMTDLISIQNWHSGLKPIRKRLKLSLIYPDMGKNNSDLFSFLLMAGYLKAERVEWNKTGSYSCDLFLPNTEIEGIFQSEIIRRLLETDEDNSHELLQDLQSSMQQGDHLKMQEDLDMLLRDTVSYFDITQENSHHMLLLGLFTCMRDDYYISSNRESGYGRYDIQLEPKQEGDPGIILELKTLQGKKPKDLKKELNNAALDAIAQSKENRYDTELQKRGIHPIRIYGIAFWKKNVVVVKDSP